ncbi:MAG: antitoxin [bacterium]
MKMLTIRGVDESLSARIKKAAQNESLSVNQYIINLLKKQFGQAKKKKFTNKYSDLDSLFGQWDEEEWQTIKNELDAQRTIDVDLWHEAHTH